MVWVSVREVVLQSSSFTLRTLLFSSSFFFVAFLSLLRLFVCLFDFFFQFYYSTFHFSLDSLISDGIFLIIITKSWAPLPTDPFPLKTRTQWHREKKGFSGCHGVGGYYCYCPWCSCSSEYSRFILLSSFSFAFVFYINTLAPSFPAFPSDLYIRKSRIRLEWP